MGGQGSGRSGQADISASSSRACRQAVAELPESPSIRTISWTRSSPSRRNMEALVRPALICLLTRKCASPAAAMRGK